MKKGKNVEGPLASSRMQRIEALLNNERVDRVPLWFMMEGFCARTLRIAFKSSGCIVLLFKLFQLDE